MRWDLVCERKQFPRYIQMTFFVGNLVGVALSGPLADNFGRKLAFNIFFTLWFLSGLFGWYADSLYAWAFARFCVGAFSLGFNNIIAAWAIELSATHAVPEWGGQRVVFRTEEDAVFDGQTVRYLDGRQTELHLIGGK